MPLYKTALITGASSGFGRSIALDLAHQGIEFVAAGRRLDRLTTLAAEHKKIIPFQLDVPDLIQIEALYQFLKTKNLLPEILINSPSHINVNTLEVMPTCQA